MILLWRVTIIILLLLLLLLLHLRVSMNIIDQCHRPTTTTTKRSSKRVKAHWQITSIRRKIPLVGRLKEKWCHLVQCHARKKWLMVSAKHLLSLFFFDFLWNERAIHVSLLLWLIRLWTIDVLFLSSVGDCLRYMQEGSDFLKVRSYARQFRRLYKLNETSTAISWYPTSKKPSKAMSEIDHPVRWTSKSNVFFSSSHDRFDQRNPIRKDDRTLARIRTSISKWITLLHYLYEWKQWLCLTRSRRQQCWWSEYLGDGSVVSDCQSRGAAVTSR